MQSHIDGVNRINHCNALHLTIIIDIEMKGSEKCIEKNHNNQHNNIFYAFI